MNTPNIIDQVVRCRRRTVALHVTAEAKLIVRAPYRAPMSVIQDFVQRTLPWIIKKKRQAQEKMEQVRRKQFVDGEQFLYLGEWRRLSVDLATTGPLTLNENGFLLPAVTPQPAEQIFESWFRERAAEIIGPRASEWAESSGLRFASLNITGAKTRWGSCNLKKKLNFSWRLVMAPPDVIDYVVVHELVHLEHLNHSRLFWDKVQRLYPNFRAAKTWLKKNQHLMTLT